MTQAERMHGGEGTLDVSVIVAVYNGMPYLTESLDSVFGQDLDARRYEVIVVDDGSTDGSIDVERRFAAEHPNCVLVELPHSGSPAAPRNAGIERARGRYLFFFDADDILASYALSDMLAAAEANDVDIVVPKQKALGGRSVPIQAFRATLPKTDIYEADVYRILGPVKLFRTTFVRDNGITFPEGVRRKSDVPFGVQTYLRARGISVLADRDYLEVRLRDDGGNLTVRRTALSDHLPVVRFVFGEVAEQVAEGPKRNQLMTRHFRTELAKAVLEGFPGEPDEAFRRACFDEFADIARRYCNEDVLYGLPVRERIVAYLLLEGRYEDLCSISGPLAGRMHADVTRERGTLYLKQAGFRDPALAIPERIYRVGVKSCAQASATALRDTGAGAEVDIVVRILMTNDPTARVGVELAGDSGRVQPVLTIDAPEVVEADVRQVEIALPLTTMTAALRNCRDGRWTVRAVVEAGGVTVNPPVSLLESAKRPLGAVAERSPLTSPDGRPVTIDRNAQGRMVVLLGSERPVADFVTRVYGLVRRVIKSAVRRVRN